ncbi:hypothetical protein [Aquitalea sp. ASV11]|uniref:hypothetical protein n=1 Tax=Aquitalea sp. ASV11 TaxID=2795103 RepID=UPI0018EA9ECF|nr:hypothetical protein [Aquitalea sp. ASV11]
MQQRSSVSLFSRHLAGLCMCLLMLADTQAAPRSQQDLRSFMHGVVALPTAQNGHYDVFFSSAGLPPRGEDAQGRWQHDVYLLHWHSDEAVQGQPQILIARPEAQEPVSAARNSRGHVMLTFEDGWNSKDEVSQRYAVYDAAMRPIKPYPQTAVSGGHSGHVAAVGERFVLFYSDGWVDGDGVNGQGSGNGVYAQVYDGQGEILQSIDVVDEERAWWPMLAGGERTALLVWQQITDGQKTGQLNMAVLDPQRGSLSDIRLLSADLQLYHYNLAWLPAVSRFVVLATIKGQGMAWLLDSAGQLKARLDCLPATVRESGLMVSGTTVFTPTADGRLMQLAAGPDSLQLQGLLRESKGRPVPWRPVGSVGLPRRDGRLDWLSLTERGVQWWQFDPRQTSPARSATRCASAGDASLQK